MPQNNKTKLILIRHAESVANATQIIQSDTFDAPLSDLGKRQAETLANRLAGLSFDRLFTSSYSRAIQTAAYIRKFHMDVPYAEMRELRERFRGPIGGMSKDEFEEKHPELVEQWRKEIDARPEGGENFEDLHNRVVPLLEKHAKENPGKTLLYVIHGNVIKAVVGHAMGWNFGKRWQIPQDNCAVTCLGYDPTTGHWEVEYVNKTFSPPV